MFFGQVVLHASRQMALWLGFAGCLKQTKHTLHLLDTSGRSTETPTGPCLSEMGVSQAKMGTAGAFVFPKPRRGLLPTIIGF